MLAATLASNLTGNVLSGTGIIRTGKGTIIAGQSF